MSSNRSPCGLGALAGIIVGIMTNMASACTPPLTVSLGGLDPEWVHVDCPLTVDADASGGIVGNWKYYAYPGGICDICLCQYWLMCGDPPVSSCSVFTSVGTYRVYVDVDECDGFCEITRSASDSKTVYAVKVDLSAESTCAAAGGPRVRVDLIVQWAGPTTGAIVALSLVGSARVYDSETGGNLLLQSGQAISWPVGSQPSSVWVEGTAPSNCSLQISCRDSNGWWHPCTTYPHVDFTLCGPSQCCEGGNCIDKCDPDGNDCVFRWPPVETPHTGCLNPDPTDKSCEPVIDGLICAWEQTGPAYHLTSAKCAGCASDCREPSGDACMQIRPWKCNNDWMPFGGFFCVCNADIAGPPQDVGTHYRCK